MIRWRISKILIFMNLDKIRWKIDAVEDFQNPYPQETGQDAREMGKLMCCYCQISKILIHMNQIKIRGKVDV